MYRKDVHADVQLAYGNLRPKRCSCNIDGCQVMLGLKEASSGLTTVDGVPPPAVGE